MRGYWMVLAALSLTSCGDEVEPPYRFDGAVCAGVEPFLDAPGRDLQRAEVAGRYVLDASSFREHYVAARMGGMQVPGLPQVEVPGEYEIEWAEGEDQRRIVEQRGEAERRFLLESPDVYEQVGPVLELSVDGTWSSSGVDGASLVGGGTYVTRHLEVVLLDERDPDVETRGVRPIRLNLQEGDLASDRVEWVLREWPDQGIRRYRRVGPAGSRSVAPSNALPAAPPRSALVGIWRIRRGTMEPVLRDWRETSRQLEEGLKGLEGPELEPLRRATSALRLSESCLTQTYRLSDDGRLLGVVLTDGAWKTTACGRWIQSGRTVVAWVAAQGGRRLDLQVWTYLSGRCLERITRGASLAYDRVSP
jgi:hypothetical protein